MTEAGHSKELYLLRHGIAAEPGTGGFTSDAERPLTPEGKSILKRTAEAMLAMGIEFDLILSSPLVRAKQTAELIRQGLGTSTEICFTDNLVLRADARELLREISENYPRKKNILLVGHEPFLSALISRLISGNDQCPIEMKKGGLCKLAVFHLKFGRCARLEWLLAPGQLTRIS